MMVRTCFTQIIKTLEESLLFTCSTRGEGQFKNRHTKIYNPGIIREYLDAFIVRYDSLTSSVAYAF